MTNANTVAQAYIDAWNETNPAARKAKIADGWTRDATYVDPLMNGQGHDGIEGLIAGVQNRFPGFRFALLGTPDGHGDHVRFSWSLGPDGADAPIGGTDFVTVADGRIRSVTGFLDKVPAQ